MCEPARQARHLKTRKALENTRGTNTEQLSFPVLLGVCSRANTNFSSNGFFKVLG